MKHAWSKRLTSIARIGMVAASIVMALPTDALACSGIYLGSNYTQDGATYLGRSEDYGNGARYRKVFGIKPASSANTGTYNNEAEVDAGDPYFSRPMPKETFKYSYVTDSSHAWEGYPEAYAEAGINDHGVAISATVTTYMSAEMTAVDPKPATGVTEFNLGSILLGESTSARGAVEVAGKVIDEYGAGENFQFFAADATESWLFMGLSGHQWIGIKLGSDVVSCNPNMSTLSFRVDLDSADVLHSANIKSLPDEHGLTRTFEDGAFDIATTYGGVGESAGNVSRYFQCAYYWNKAYSNSLTATEISESGAAKKKYDITGESLFFTPEATYDTFSILRSLGTQGEGSKYDTTSNPDIYAVGNNRQLECHFFQARQNQGYDSDMAIIEWLAPSRAEYSVYVPMYTALMSEAPTEWQEGSTDAQTAPSRPTTDQMVAEALEDNYSNAFIYVAQDLNTLASSNRELYGKPVREYLDALQKEIIAQQESVDAIMKDATHEERIHMANDLSAELTTSTYAYMKEVLDQLRAHVAKDRANGTPSAFVPENLPSTKDLVYVELIDTPRFSGEIPGELSYTQGEQATPINLSATAATGSVLSYSVEELGASDDRAASTPSGMSFTPNTSEVGSKTYRLSVYNRAGKADTRDVVVNVRAAEVTPDTPEVTAPEATAPEVAPKPAKTTSARALPKTSDIVLPVAFVAAAGAAILAISLVGRKRKTH